MVLTRAAAVKPRFFATAAAFHAWLARNHATASELLVGFHKAHTGKPGMTYQQALDEALCFGWIDAVRRTLDDERWSIRFTPRKPKGNWSQINVKRVAELTAAGRMQPSGLAAFTARVVRRAGYSYEEAPGELDAAQLKQFRAVAGAWQYFQGTAPSYQRTAIHWVVRAKKAETRVVRLDALIDWSRRGAKLPHLDPSKYKKVRKG